MNRELRFDANQISLGDNALLTLELRAETTQKTLLQELAGTGALRLTLDQLGAGSKEPYAYYFSYSIDPLTELLTLHVDSDLNRNPVLGRLVPPKLPIDLKDRQAIELTWQLREWQEEGAYLVKGELGSKAEGRYQSHTNLDFGPAKLVVTESDAEQPVRVTMTEAKREGTADQGLWALIRHRSLDFNRYRTFMDSVLCAPAGSGLTSLSPRYALPFNRLASYTMLKYATELYMMQEAGLALYSTSAATGGANLNTNPRPDADETRRLGSAGSLNSLREEYLDELENQEGRVLPYFKLIREKLSEVPLKEPSALGSGVQICYGILKSKLQAPPLLELIWSYWHEESGLVQTMNAISLRFQNVRQGGRGQDPLANLNLDPLRPLSNLLWGYIEDERNRLTLNRRNLEYQYEYGIGLIGRAVQSIPAAEHRTFFLRGFHSLLRAATEFYQQANFTTVIPDGFPILNHLREVHLVLAEGAHNQYGDLPWTARAEMLVQQWLLARPEVREFLGGRIMVPYNEPWMDRVDNMKQLQGWNPANVSHFHDLAVVGEQLLLSIRYGSWNGSTVGATNAANWAYYWREEIQRYIHAYKAVTGVDLASDVVDARVSLPDSEERYLQPAQLIERQAAMQQRQLRRNQQLSGPLAMPGRGQSLPGRNGYLD